MPKFLKKLSGTFTNASNARNPLVPWGEMNHIPVFPLWCHFGWISYWLSRKADGFLEMDHLDLTVTFLDNVQWSGFSTHYQGTYSRLNIEIELPGISQNLMDILMLDVSLKLILSNKRNILLRYSVYFHGKIIYRIYTKKWPPYTP